MIEPKADLAIPLCNPYSPFPPAPASLSAAQRSAGSRTDLQGKPTTNPVTALAGVGTIPIGTEQVAQRGDGSAGHNGSSPPEEMSGREQH
jgi:hypothetical protein